MPIRSKFYTVVAGAAPSLATLTAVAGTAVTAGPARAAGCDMSLPFRNPALPLNTKINDLIGRLTTAQKIGFLHQYQPAIGAPLRVPMFKTGTEALHGVAWFNENNSANTVVDSHGTTFPQATGLASTWDPSLIQQVGTAVGQDARGYNAEDPAVWGLNLWPPVTNLLRNPLWGRNEEGYSEDAYLTAAIATAYGRGMEGSNPRYLLAAPTLKHYLAYNNEVNRAFSSSEVPPRVLQEYYQAAFRGPLQAGAATGVTASYNQVNMRPDTVNPDLNTIERSWSAQPLMNVTDAGADYNVWPGYLPDREHADAAALKAGIDSFTTDNNDPSKLVTALTAALVGSSSAGPAARATLQVNGEVIPPRNLAVLTHAENFDDYSGAQLVDQSKASGTAVGATAPGQWIEFADASLRDSPATFTTEAAKGTPGTAQIQIRLDNPVTRPVVGTASVASTGDVYSYTTTSARLTGAHGIRDVYLVFTGDLRIASFSMR